MDRNTRRFVAAAFVVAASCNVYDPSLLVGGGGSSSSGATGGKGSGGSSGKGGAGTSGSTVGGSGGSGGTAGNGTGGSGGAASGRGGTGGSGGAGATAGTGGMEQLGGAGADGGEAGMGPVTGGASGTGGQGGSGGAGAAGKGGTSGAGSGGAGAGGTAGTGGAGSGGAGAGSGGSAGAVTASGCAKLTVPITESTDQARFAISYSTSSPINLSTTGTITINLYIASGNAGVIAPYVQDTSYNLLRSAATTALSGTGTWKTINWDVAAEPLGSSTISRTSIIRIGIQIWANGATSGFATTVVDIDSIAVSAPAATYPFTTSSTVYTTPISSYENVPGVMWLNNYDADTLPETLPGTSLAWVATCP